VKGAGMKVKVFLYYLFKNLLAAHNSLYLLNKFTLPSVAYMM